MKYEVSSVTLEFIVCSYAGSNHLSLGRDDLIQAAEI